MANDFHGDAEIIVGGASKPVHANLRIVTGAGLPSWAGVLESPDVDWFDLLGTDVVEIRLPTGRTGKVLIRTHQIGNTTAQVQGSGPPPF